MILAIDTATRLASIALYDDAGVIREHTWHSRNNHTVELVPNIHRVLDRQALRPRELEGVAVALGPGSFTGLRIGMSVAKGLAFAASIPLAAVSTLDVVAYPHLHRSLPLCAVIQAGRGRVCAAFYATGSGELEQQGEARITTVAELVDEIQDQTLFCGEVSPDNRAVLRDRLEGRALIASPANALRRAGYLAELGWRQIERGQIDDPATIAPLYLHHPDIDH